MTIRAFTIPRTVHLTSQALPAAGAYTAQAFSDLRVGAKTLTFNVTYTRGAAGGYPVYRLQWDNGTEVSDDLIQDDGSITVAGAEATVQNSLFRPLGPPPDDANAITYVLEAFVPWGAKKVRLSIAEAGDTANPGTAAIVFTGGIGGP